MPKKENEDTESGVYVELTTGEHGALSFGASEFFSEDESEDTKEWLRNIVYGIYYAVHLHPEMLLAFGETARQSDGFWEFANPENEAPEDSGPMAYTGEDAEVIDLASFKKPTDGGVH
jgi:hypothetical protein